MIKNIFQWLAYSSADPTQFSLTLKAGLPFLALLGLGQFTVDATNTITALTNLLVVTGQMITALMTVYGILRKIFLTLSNNFTIK